MSNESLITHHITKSTVRTDHLYDISDYRNELILLIAEIDTDKATKLNHYQQERETIMKPKRDDGKADGLIKNKGNKLALLI